MLTITNDDFAALVDSGITIVDVREPHEYVNGHVVGAVTIPLAFVGARSAELPKGEPIYVICQGGGRSRVGVDVLVAQGFDAINVEGGTGAWVQAGRPVVVGPTA